MANGVWKESPPQSSDSLLLYDRSAGQVNLVTFNSMGVTFNSMGIVKAQATNDSWRTTWDLIVPADFLGNQQPPEV